MTESQEPRFGDAYYHQQRQLYGASGYWAHGLQNSYEDFVRTRDAALADPEVDFFDTFMPTGRSKHDIGRYALRNGIEVPLIGSLEELREAAVDDAILIRSDGSGEYDGPSGLRSSPRLIRTQYGRFEVPLPQEKSLFYSDSPENWYDVTHPDYFPPPEEPILAGCDELVLHAHRLSGTSEYINHLHNRLTTRYILNGEMYPGATLGIYASNSSLWRYIQGDNIVMMRDPVQEDLYHFKWGEYTSSKVHTSEYDEGYPIFEYGNGIAKHYQRKVDYGDRNDLERAIGAWDWNKKEWGPNPSLLPKLWAPIHEAIDMYETVRTLPFFDQRQVPVMEMQYSREQKKLYFLQYLKTGRLLNHLEAFPLPASPTTVVGHDVVGATEKEGDSVRLYMGITSENVEKAYRMIKGEGVVIPHELILTGAGSLQSLALESRIAMIEWGLTFHNHHFGSAMFTRTPLSVGLYDGYGQINERIYTAYRENTELAGKRGIGYMNVTVTSNGRQVAVDSDWRVHPAEDV